MGHLERTAHWANILTLVLLTLLLAEHNREPLRVSAMRWHVSVRCSGATWTAVATWGCMMGYCAFHDE
jgi:hypothetical protein